MSLKEKRTNIGIGFVTGRKTFRDVLTTHMNNWSESVFPTGKTSLHLLIAYDLDLKRTIAKDYMQDNAANLDIVDSAYYIGENMIQKEIETLVDTKVVTQEEADLVFGGGYAGKRNIILFLALKKKMDYLIFLDDDDYPMAPVKFNNALLWTGQKVVETHLRYLKDCDVTQGHHCGYISPIPAIEYTEQQFSEKDFKLLIESVSSDVVDWASMKNKMDNQGIDYVDLYSVTNGRAAPVKEVNGMKFISGGNLGFNLKNRARTFPFYNPPGARGENTFLSTCLGKSNVQKVPVWTFHDEFGSYHHILSGMLPTKLKPVSVRSAGVRKRFYQACVGWVRYKPLYLYITKQGQYETEMNEVRRKLEKVIPRLCSYFATRDFENLLVELDQYHANVKEHYQEFETVKAAWAKIMVALNAGSNR